MESHQLHNTDSWLDSMPPWSSSLPAPFRPWSSAQRVASSIDNERIRPTTTALSLLSQFLRTKTALELDDLAVIIDQNAGIKLGEGMTYIVEKRPVIRSRASRHIPADWVAVKRAKCVIPKTHGGGFAMPSSSLKRLTAVLLEIEILLHPPLRNHQNIVHLMGFSWDADGYGFVPLLVMEFALFGTLVELFHTQRVEDVEKQELCLDVAQGLEAHHSSMVVHGDIKQDNILVFPHPQRKFVAKLSDFGLSLLGCDQAVYRGTAVYNAPEVHWRDSIAESKWDQMASRMPPDQLSKCDVFSYGLLVFEILNGGRRYYSFPETISFREKLMREAGDDSDILMSATTFLDSVSMPADLAQICRAVFRSTLRSSPPDRLPDGWNSVKSFFSAVLPEFHKLPTARTQPLRPKFNSKQSVLEVMNSSVSRHWAADDFLAEWKLVAEMGLKEERAQASFNLCLASAGKFRPFGAVQDDPLDWLMQASVLGSKQALTIGQRIFEACQRSVPDVFTSTTGCIPNLTGVLDETTSVSYYSNAVRYLWSKEIQKTTTRHIKELWKINRAFHGTGDLDLGCQFKDVKSSAIVDETFLLHLVICTGTADDLTYLLDLGSDLNKRTPEGITALHLACIHAKTEMITILARYGADASINDIDNISPLHWIILFQEADIVAVVAILAQAGAKINSCVPERGRKYFDDLGLVLEATPLWWAVMCRKNSAISVLISHGAEFFFECRTSNSRKSRSCCIDASLGTVCPDTLELLLESGTLLHDLTIEEKEMSGFVIGTICSNQFLRWCMHGLSYEKAYSEMLSVLRHFDISFSYRWPGTEISDRLRFQNTTPLMAAASRGDLQLVKALILDGEDKNFRLEENGPTAIETVLSSYFVGGVPAKIEMIEFLLDTGAEENPIPDISIFEGAPSKYEVFNGLLGVALRNHAPIPIFQFLLTRAPRETYYGWAGKRVLGCILEIYEAPDSIQLVSMFLDSGADPNAEDRHESSGWNCCYTAAAHGVKHRNWDFTKLCLDRGSSMEYGTSKAIVDRSCIC